MTEVAKAPLKSGRIRSLGLLWALVFIAVGALGIREALAVQEVIKSTWVADATGSLDGLQRGPWLYGVAAGALLLALILIVIALKPRPREGFRLEAEQPVYLARKVAGSLALSSARRVDGVLSASTRVSKKKVDVLAKSTSTDDAVKTGVSSAIEKRLQSLKEQPAVKVRLRQERGSQ